MRECAIDLIFTILLHSHPCWGLCFQERNHWIVSIQ